MRGEVEICLSFVSQLELTFCKLPFYTLLHAKPCGVIKTKLLGWIGDDPIAKSTLDRKSVV